MTYDQALVWAGLIASLIAHIFGIYDRRKIKSDAVKARSEPIQIHVFLVVDPTGVQEPKVQVYKDHDYR